LSDNKCQISLSDIDVSDSDEPDSDGPDSDISDRVVEPGIQNLQTRD